MNKLYLKVTELFANSDFSTVEIPNQDKIIAMRGRPYSLLEAFNTLKSESSDFTVETPQLLEAAEVLIRLIDTIQNPPPPEPEVEETPEPETVEAIEPTVTVQVPETLPEPPPPKQVVNEKRIDLINKIDKFKSQLKFFDDDADYKGYIDDLEFLLESEEYAEFKLGGVITRDDYYNSMDFKLGKKLTKKDIYRLMNLNHIIFNYSRSAEGNLSEVSGSYITGYEEGNEDYSKWIKPIQVGTRINKYDAGRISDIKNIHFSESVHGDVAVRNAEKKPIITIFQLLREGDQIQLVYLVANDSDALRRAGLHHDVLNMIVYRDGDTKYQFNITDYISPDNIARAVRYFNSEIEMQMVGVDPKDKFAWGGKTKRQKVSLIHREDIKEDISYPQYPSPETNEGLIYGLNYLDNNGNISHIKWFDSIWSRQSEITNNNLELINRDRYTAGGSVGIRIGDEVVVYNKSNKPDKFFGKYGMPEFLGRVIEFKGNPVDGAIAVLEDVMNMEVNKEFNQREYNLIKTEDYDKRFAAGGRIRIPDSDIQIGNRFGLPNGEVLEIKNRKLEGGEFTKEFIITFTRSSDKQYEEHENTIHSLLLFLNNWKAQLINKHTEGVLGEKYWVEHAKGGVIKLADNYFVKYRTIETGSNYDKSVAIFRKGEKTPVCGTILKNTSTDDDIRAWANDRIKTGFESAPILGAGGELDRMDDFVELEMLRLATQDLGLAGSTKNTNDAEKYNAAYDVFLSYSKEHSRFTWGELFLIMPKEKQKEIINILKLDFDKYKNKFSEGGLVVFDKEMEKVAEHANYNYYMGLDKNGRTYYNIAPKEQQVPSGGYYSKEYILGIKHVPDLFPANFSTGGSPITDNRSPITNVHSAGGGVTEFKIGDKVISYKGEQILITNIRESKLDKWIDGDLYIYDWKEKIGKIKDVNIRDVEKVGSTTNNKQQTTNVHSAGGGVTEFKIGDKVISYKGEQILITNIRESKLDKWIDGDLYIYDWKEKIGKIKDVNIRDVEKVGSTTNNKQQTTNVHSAGGSVGRQLYIEWSSWFDSHPYDIEKIKAAAESAGGKNIHTENQFGWSNQPEVVVFNGDKEAVTKAVQEALGTDWIIVREKDWRIKKHESGDAVGLKERYNACVGEYMESQEGKGFPVFVRITGYPPQFVSYHSTKELAQTKANSLNRKIKLAAGSIVAPPYATGQKTIDGVIVVDADKEFDDNPLFYIWSEYPTYSKIIDGRLHYRYEFYTDKKGNKYFVVSELIDIPDDEIKEYISKHDWDWARNVDEFVDGADKDSYIHWLDMISLKGGKLAAGGSVDSDIQKIKKSLIAKAKSKGLYENFGQKEVRQLQDKYGYTPEVAAFDNWAMNYDLSDFATGGTVNKVITFSNSSHTSTPESNRKANEQLREILYNDKKNPIYNELNREDIMLDSSDGGGYIALVYSSMAYPKYLSDSKIKKFLEYLKTFVSMDSYVYIGDYNYKFNNYLKAKPKEDFEDDDFATGGKIRSIAEYNKLVHEKENLVKNLTPAEIADMWNKNSNAVKSGDARAHPMTEEEAKPSHIRGYLRNLLIENELTEAEYKRYFSEGGSLITDYQLPITKIHAEGGKIGGRGWGSFEKGKRITDIKELKVGNLYLEYSTQFNTKNIVIITSGDATGLNRDIVYGSFVRPENLKHKEEDFAIWGYGLKYDEIYEIKGRKYSEGGTLATDYRLPITDYRLPITDSPEIANLVTYVDTSNQLAAKRDAIYMKKVEDPDCDVSNDFQSFLINVVLPAYKREMGTLPEIDKPQVEYFALIHVQEFPIWKTENYSAGGAVRKKCPVGTEEVSLIFAKEHFTEQKAKDWAKEHKHLYGTVIETDNTYRIPQQDDKLFKSFGVIPFTKGVQALIGCPKRKKKMAAGGDVPDVQKQAAIENAIEIAAKAHDNGVIASDLSFNEFAEKVFRIEGTSYGKGYLLLAYEALKKLKYAKGSKIFKTKQEVYTKLRKLVNEIQPADIEKAIKINTVATDFYNNMPDYAAGGKIGKVEWQGKTIGDNFHVWEHESKDKHWFIDAYENSNTHKINLNVYEKYGNSDQPIFYGRRTDGGQMIGYDNPYTLPRYVKDKVLEIYLANSDEVFSAGGGVERYNDSEQEKIAGLILEENKKDISPASAKELAKNYSWLKKEYKYDYEAAKNEIVKYYREEQAEKAKNPELLKVVAAINKGTLKILRGGEKKFGKIKLSITELVWARNFEDGFRIYVYKDGRQIGTVDLTASTKWKPEITEAFSDGGKISPARLHEILNHYVTAALWSSPNMDAESDDEMLDAKYSYSDISKELLEQMKADITKFVTENAEAIEKSGMSDEQLGHDLWLTRNHHGAGFFDRGYDDEIEKQLMDAAHALKETDLYVGDDGKIYAQGSYTAGGEVGSSKGKNLPKEYYAEFTLKGNYRRKYNIFQGHSDSQLKEAVRKIMPKVSYDEHLALAKKYHTLYKEFEKKRWDLIESEFENQFGRKYQIYDYKVSGIARDDFSEDVKNKIRSLLDKEHDYYKAFELHNAQLRKKDKFSAGGEIDDFVVHGSYTVSNSGGYEIMLSDDGEAARVRDAFSFDNDSSKRTSDWLPIEYILNEEGEKDDDGDYPIEPVIDPKGYNIPLNMVMRVRAAGGEIQKKYPDFKNILKNAKATVLREGYDVVIFYDPDFNGLSFARIAVIKHKGDWEAETENIVWLEPHYKGGIKTVEEHYNASEIKNKIESFSDDGKISNNDIVLKEASNEKGDYFIIKSLTDAGEEWMEAEGYKQGEMIHPNNISLVKEHAKQKGIKVEKFSAGGSPITDNRSLITDVRSAGGKVRTPKGIYIFPATKQGKYAKFIARKVFEAGNEGMKVNRLLGMINKRFPETKTKMRTVQMSYRLLEQKGFVRKNGTWFYEGK